ncbi:hypothetical protein BBJ28_00017815 [Nothophytophthora sp. Chile5]|nr:hypothetical protein BBJ28_00017815 [Nothophytophthora sp. Chile5]
MRAGKQRSGETPATEDFSREDSLALMACLQHGQPMCPADWESVLERYRATHATPSERAQRDVASLKKHFKAVLKARKPMEAISSPAEVREVLTIGKAISKKKSVPTQQKRTHQDAPRHREAANDSQGDIAVESAPTDSSDTVAPMIRVTTQASSQASQVRPSRLGKRPRHEQPTESDLPRISDSASLLEIKLVLRQLLAKQQVVMASERRERQMLAQKLARIERLCTSLGEKVDKMSKSVSDDMEELRDDMEEQGQLSALLATTTILFNR